MQSSIGDRCGVREAARDASAVWVSLRSRSAAAAFAELINVKKAFNQRKFPQLHVLVNAPPLPAPTAAAAKQHTAGRGQTAQAPAAGDAGACVQPAQALPSSRGRGGPGGEPCAAAPPPPQPEAEPERRLAADGSGPYTEQEFREFYEGTEYDASQEWKAAGWRMRKQQQQREKQDFNVSADVLAGRAARLARFGERAVPAEAEEANVEVRCDGDFDEDACAPIVGRCMTLEKEFVRSAAGLRMNPSLVRPVPVLRRALKHVLWRQSGMAAQRREAYCREQLKSIRQDLTVQHVHTPFTTEVYEVHARLCIEFGDRAELVICLAKLSAYHRREDMRTSVERAVEFTAYKLLFVAVTGQERELCAEIGALTAELRRAGPIRHALAVVRALAPLSVWELRTLYRDAPNMGQTLLRLFMRPPFGLTAQVWRTLLRAYKPKLPHEWARRALLFDLGAPDELAAAGWRYRATAADLRRCSDDDASDGGEVDCDPSGTDSDSAPTEDSDEDPAAMYSSFLEWARAVQTADGVGVDCSASLRQFAELQEFLKTRKDFHETTGRMEMDADGVQL
eukprot:TRINITY_DN8549_c0_g1_i1.p1 TRINITY_DN8549_c0_g1~~TRINITY_DN8549_c0_g1_i1.p1  ORF type:complete len:566 (+),score=139.58 TRINITY_DN8549_c0_g1_i1:548-2245(+)